MKKAFVGVLATPLTVTLTGPVVAVAGTVAVIWLSDQLVTVAFVPLNVTVLLPCVAPNHSPVICTEVPTGPLPGFRPSIRAVVEYERVLTNVVTARRDSFRRFRFDSRDTLY